MRNTTVKADVKEIIFKKFNRIYDTRTELLAIDDDTTREEATRLQGFIDGYLDMMATMGMFMDYLEWDRNNVFAEGEQ